MWIVTTSQIKFFLHLHRVWYSLASLLLSHTYSPLKKNTIIFIFNEITRYMRLNIGPDQNPLNNSAGCKVAASPLWLPCALTLAP